MDELDNFVEENRQDKDKVNRFTTLNSAVSSPIPAGAIWFILAVSINYILAEFSIGTQNGELRDPVAWAGMIIPLILVFGAYLLLLQRKSHYHINNRDVLLHYLSLAIEYHQDGDHKNVVRYLKKFREYDSGTSTSLIHPIYQEQFHEYIDLLENSEPQEQDEILAETFCENIRSVIDNISSADSVDIIIPKEEKDEPTNSSGIRILVDEISEAITVGWLKQASGLIFLLVAIVSYFIWGPTPALVILGAFPVLRSLFSVSGGQRQDT